MANPDPLEIAEIQQFAAETLFAHQNDLVRSDNTELMLAINPAVESLGIQVIDLSKLLNHSTQTIDFAKATGTYLERNGRDPDQEISFHIFVKIIDVINDFASGKLTKEETKAKVKKELAHFVGAPAPQQQAAVEPEQDVGVEKVAQLAGSAERAFHADLLRYKQRLQGRQQKSAQEQILQQRLHLVEDIQSKLEQGASIKSLRETVASIASTKRGERRRRTTVITRADTSAWLQKRFAVIEADLPRYKRLDKLRERLQQGEMINADFNKLIVEWSGHMSKDLREQVRQLNQELVDANVGMFWNAATEVVQRWDIISIFEGHEPFKAAAKDHAVIADRLITEVCVDNIVNQCSNNKERLIELERLVEIAYACFQKGNFFAASQLSGVLESSALSRFHPLHEFFSKQTRDKLTFLRKVCNKDGNFKVLRQCQSQANTKSCSATYISADVLFAHDGMKIKSVVGIGVLANVAATLAENANIQRVKTPLDEQRVVAELPETVNEKSLYNRAKELVKGNGGTEEREQSIAAMKSEVKGVKIDPMRVDESRDPAYEEERNRSVPLSINFDANMLADTVLQNADTIQAWEILKYFADKQVASLNDDLLALLREGGLEDDQQELIIQYIEGDKTEQKNALKELGNKHGSVYEKIKKLEAAVKRRMSDYIKMFAKKILHHPKTQDNQALQEVIVQVSQYQNSDKTPLVKFDKDDQNLLLMFESAVDERRQRLHSPKRKQLQERRRKIQQEREQLLQQHTAVKAAQAAADDVNKLIKSADVGPLAVDDIAYMNAKESEFLGEVEESIAAIEEYVSVDTAQRALEQAAAQESLLKIPAQELVASVFQAAHVVRYHAPEEMLANDKMQTVTQKIIDVFESTYNQDPEKTQTSLRDENVQEALKQCQQQYETAQITDADRLLSLATLQVKTERAIDRTSILRQSEPRTEATAALKAYQMFLKIRINKAQQADKPALADKLQQRFDVAQTVIDNLANPNANLKKTYEDFRIATRTGLFKKVKQTAHLIQKRLSGVKENTGAMSSKKAERQLREMLKKIERDNKVESDEPSPGPSAPAV